MISYSSMSSGRICRNCGKGKMYGHEVSHAKNRSKRFFEPNLHSGKMMINGALKRVQLCVKCLRKLKKVSKKEIPQTKTSATAAA